MTGESAFLQNAKSYFICFTSKFCLRKGHYRNHMKELARSLVVLIKHFVEETNIKSQVL